MNQIIRWWKLRRLRIAQEKYAWWKGRHDALESGSRYAGIVYAHEIANAAGQVEKYSARIECFNRE